MNVPAAKPIELHTPPFTFTQPIHGHSFRLADVTGDGTLDVWVESAYGVALISFQDGEFKEVFSRYTVTREKLAETPDVEYHSSEFGLEFHGQMYHRFLPSLPSKRYSYETLRIAMANVDDTQEKETVVLVAAYREGSGMYDEWSQAYLLITTTDGDGVPKKKDLFKLAVQNPPFVFRGSNNLHSWGTRTVSFKLVDLTGDGILDVWMESHHGAVVVSFQSGEFKEVLSCYASIRRDDPIEHIDLDNDGTYEIKIPDLISVDGIPTAARPDWMSLYEWDGNAYVLNNERFYAENDKFLIQLLSAYNYQLMRHGSILYHCETYRFYLGLVYHYRGSVSPVSLQWIIRHGKNENYIQAAEDITFHSGLVYYDRGELKRAQLYLQYIATEAKNQAYRKDADAVLTEIWNKTDDRKTFEWEYRRHLVAHYGDMPEVRIFLAGKKKLMSGNFRFPEDEDQFLRFYEAKYDLWPDESVLRELQKVRKAKADGTPFHLIDWDND